MFLLKRFKPGHPEWAPSKINATKTDGSLPIFVEYRTLNAIDKHDSYTKRLVEVYIDIFGEGAVLSALDANCDYC